jgi:predicted permease
MSFGGELRRRVHMLLHRGRFQQDLEEEMRLHVELRKEQRIRSGLSPEEAGRAANCRFGNVTRTKERSYMAWGWNWLETFLQDAGYGVRSMLRTPAITLVALISLALGIGANTAIFSFIDAVMLRSLPVRDPKQLVKLGDRDASGITDSFAATQLYSYPFYRQFQQKNAVFSDTAAYYSMTNHPHGFVDGRQDPELINVQTVSGTYFQTLGVEPQFGRLLNENDDSSEGDHPVVVISNGFWKRRFASDPSILGHKVRLGSTVFEIVGVTPPEFFGTQVGDSPDAFAPLSMSAVIPPGWGGYKDNFKESLHIIGRLKPGVSVEQATANVNILFRQILLSFPDAKLNQEKLSRLNKSHVTLKSMERGLSYLRRAYSEPLQVLMVIVALVLLIACANIANLLLARSTARARELAVRQALGAARTRIMRQLLTESLLLAFAGGALGIGFAAAANRVLLAMLPHGQSTIPLDVSLNLRLLGFTFVVTVCTAVLFGTLPSLRATRLQLTQSLKSGSGAAPGAARSPLGRILVASQVALSLVLMVGACLFLRTLINLSRAGMGFNKENVLRMDIDYTLTGYKDEDPRLKLLYNQIEVRVNALPGVEAASFSEFTFNEGSWNSMIFVPGMPIDRNVNVPHNIIGDAYFKTMQIPLIAGRAFGPQDTATSQRVAIISESLAKKYFPAGSPIGRTYSIGSPDAGDNATQVQVVGIVRDVKFDDIQEPPAYIDYLPYSQRGWGFGDFEVLYKGDFNAISAEVQQAIHSIDRRLPITNAMTMDELVARSYANQAIIAKLSAFFGLVAVFLSCIGLYGLMSYLVGRRTGEIGVRMALGADRSQVGWQVMREIAALVLAGIAVGLPATLASQRLVGDMLYGVKGTDPLSIAGAVFLLSSAALVAGYIPARRASRINPLSALRYE